jgi:hypothetical protein
VAVTVVGAEAAPCVVTEDEVPESELPTALTATTAKV